MERTTAFVELVNVIGATVTSLQNVFDLVERQPRRLR